MAQTSDPDATLDRIADLARRGSESTGSPEDLKRIFAEILALSTRRDGDTPGESDVPRTENQSL